MVKTVVTQSHVGLSVTNLTTSQNSKIRAKELVYASGPTKNATIISGKNPKNILGEYKYTDMVFI